MSVKESTLNNLRVGDILEMYRRGIFSDVWETSHFVKDGKIYHECNDSSRGLQDKAD